MKVLLLLLALSISLGLNAQTESDVPTVVINCSDGKKISFGFDEKPTVTFPDDFVKISTNDKEIMIPISSFKSFSFENVILSDVDGIGQDKGISYKYGMVSLNNCKPGTKVNILKIDGTIVNTLTVGDDGSVQFSTDNFVDEILLIEVSGVTYKIAKK